MAMGLGSSWLWDVGKRLARRFYHLAHGRALSIRSSRASVHAAYGRCVSVGGGTLIDKDVVLGDYSYVNRDSTVEKCDIGRYCSISSGVRINPWNHDLRCCSTSPWLGGSYKDLRDRVTIEDDVLISVNVVVLSGVRLATGSVVGAGAVVTKNTEPYEIVGGVPAKHIGWRFDTSQRQSLLKTQGLREDPDAARSKLEAALC